MGEISMTRPYADESGVPYDDPLGGCKGILTALGVSGLVVIVGLILIFVMSHTASAQDCNFNGNAITDTTVPLGTTDLCNNQGRIQLICNQVVLTAYVDDYYTVQQNFIGIVTDLYLIAGQQYHLTPDISTEWVEFWGSNGFIGLVDIVEQPCNDIVYPDDNRLNWQQGDYYAKVYLTGNHLQVYDVTTGTGVLILNVDTTYQQVACSSNICVFVFENSVQVNITDAEGKFYEINVQLIESVPN